MCEKCQSVTWRRSTRCSTGGCVEVAEVETERATREVRVRDSKDPRSPELAFGTTAWHTFIEGVKSGELDRR